MTPHTAGPWRVWIDPTDNTVNVVNSASAYVCQVGNVQAADRDQILADARAICALPELLDALKRARAALQANEEITGTWELYQQSPEMKAINAAIAKAEGR